MSEQSLLESKEFYTTKLVFMIVIWDYSVFVYLYFFVFRYVAIISQLR